VVTAAVLLAWAWIVPMGRDMYGSMRGPAAWMMTPRWDAGHLLLLFAMWAVMMAGMMLPSAAPILVLFSRMLERQSRSQTAVYLLAAGYLSVWLLFSVGAVILQRLLAERLLLTPMMELASSRLAAGLLIAVGVYQWTPLKRVCLRSCRSPLSFLSAHWHSGSLGALRTGIEHGVYCVGCCWALMLLLFAGGVMNLAVIATLTAIVILERVAPFGEIAARSLGVALVVLGAWLLVQ
jgi:predicted metal-binding membrane protein